MWGNSPYPFFMMPKKEKSSIKKFLKTLQAMEEYEAEKKKKEKDKEKDKGKPSSSLSLPQAVTLITLAQMFVGPIYMIMMFSALAYAAETFKALSKVIPN